jgi:hypothetical protein
MSRNMTAVVLLGAALILVLLLTVNIRTCDSWTGPFGFMRFTECTTEPLLQPPA